MMSNDMSKEIQFSFTSAPSSMSKNKTVDCSDIISTAWEFAGAGDSDNNDVWPLPPGPLAVPQDVNVDSGFCELIDLTDDSSEESPTIVDFSGSSDSFNHRKSITFFSGTDPFKESTQVYQCAGLKTLHFQRPAKKRKAGQQKTVPTEKPTHAEVITARIQLPSNHELPAVIKFSQQIRFLVSRVEISLDESTKVEKKELVEYEFASDSMQFNCSSDQ